MKLANTCGDFGKYFTNLEDRIRCVNAAGFRYIDISFYDPKEYTTWDSQMPRVKALTDELGIQYVQAHSPGGNPINHDQNWQELLDSTIESIRCCGLLGIPNTVVHAGCGDGISKEEFFEKNKEFYTLLFPAMEKYGVTVLIENSTKANRGNMY